MKHALTVYSFLCLPLVILCIASVSLIGYYFDKMKFGWASPWAGYVLAAGLSYWVLGFAKKAYLKYYTKFEKVMA